MTDQIRTYYVVGDDGGHTLLTKNVAPTEQHMSGAENRLKRQARKGYVVEVTGDILRGQVKILSRLNGGELDEKDVADRMKQRTGRSNGSSNSSIFSRNHIRNE